MAASNGAFIQSSSWGQGVNTYSSISRTSDDYVYNNPNFLPVWAAGNEGGCGMESIGSPATSKNGVTVGASQNDPREFKVVCGLSRDVSANDRTRCDAIDTNPINYNPSNLAYFSSRGFTDFRIKPDIVAPGHQVVSSTANPGSDTCRVHQSAGTSMATPLVSGHLALIRQYYRRGFYPTGTANPSDAMTPSAALMKATLLNGAVPLSGRIGFEGSLELRTDNPKFPEFAASSDTFDRADMSPVSSAYFDPDTGAEFGTNYFGAQVPYSPNYGFGRVNLLKSLKLAKDSQSGNANTAEPLSATFNMLAQDDKVSPNEKKHYCLRALGNGGSSNIKATLVWSDPVAATNAYFQLVNNLDLTITDSTGRYVLGNNEPRAELQRADWVNNVEQISLTNVTANALYCVTVTGTKIPTPGTTGKQAFALVVTGDFKLETNTALCSTQTTALSCPRNCNGRGSCASGVCTCSSNFFGVDCSGSYCLNGCSGNGDCVNGICKCQDGYMGIDCRYRAKEIGVGEVANIRFRAYTDMYLKFTLTSPASSLLVSTDNFPFSISLVKHDATNTALLSSPLRTFNPAATGSIYSTYRPSTPLAAGVYYLVASAPALPDDGCYYDLASISVSVPSSCYCSGKGICDTSGICSCYPGYSGPSCNSTDICVPSAQLPATTTSYCASRISWPSPVSVEQTEGRIAKVLDWISAQTTYFKSQGKTTASINSCIEAVKELECKARHAPCSSDNTSPSSRVTRMCSTTCASIRATCTITDILDYWGLDCTASGLFTTASGCWTNVAPSPAMSTPPAIYSVAVSGPVSVKSGKAVEIRGINLGLDMTQVTVTLPGGRPCTPYILGADKRFAVNSLQRIYCNVTADSSLSSPVSGLVSVVVNGVTASVATGGSANVTLGDSAWFSPLSVVTSVASNGSVVVTTNVPSAQQGIAMKYITARLTNTFTGLASSKSLDLVGSPSTVSLSVDRANRNVIYKVEVFLCNNPSFCLNSTVSNLRTGSLVNQSAVCSRDCFSGLCLPYLSSASSFITGRCSCPSKYTFDDCSVAQTASSCSSTCVHGTCEWFSEKTQSCLCAEGWTGPTCSTQVSPSAPTQVSASMSSSSVVTVQVFLPSQITGLKFLRVYFQAPRAVSASYSRGWHYHKLDLPYDFSSVAPGSNATVTIPSSQFYVVTGDVYTISASLCYSETLCSSPVTQSSTLTAPGTLRSPAAVVQPSLALLFVLLASIAVFFNL
eukprot:GILI01005574.1.p1 GENE.GILI01005574.1~~GILI01005574.1.p1  ORF type:complete len:1406 (-),score=381.11 GILI01005574.1:329-4021(-)